MRTEDVLKDLGLDEDLTPEDIGVIWKDLQPSDFPEAWHEVEEREGMGLATLVELMSQELEPHQRSRIMEALTMAHKTATVTVLLRNYNGESPIQRRVTNVTKVEVTEDMDGEEGEGLFRIGAAPKQTPLLVLHTVSGQSTYQLEEVVGWEESHE